MGRQRATRPAEQLAERVRDVGLDGARFVDVTDGSKASTVIHSDPSNRGDADSVAGNYGVYAGEGLVILDVDEGDAEGISELETLPETYTVRSPHADDEAEGHRYYRVEGNVVEVLPEEFGVTNPQPSWGEVRAHNQYAVGPGSTLTDCKHGCCAPDTPGRYVVGTDASIATITTEELVELLSADSDLQERDEPDSTPSANPTSCPADPLEYDEANVAAVEAAMREFRADDRTTARAFQYVMDLLQGRYAKRGFEGDRSAAEECTASKLYGVLRFAGDVENAERKIYAAMSEYADSHRYTDDGDVRKWLSRGPAYRRATVQSAVSTFDLQTWQRFRHRRADGHEWTDEYSAITYDHVLKALRTVYELKPGYPYKQDVIGVAQKLDPSRSSRSHETALSRLQTEYGQVKLAYLGGNEYVYYPASEPDPANAEFIRYGGEEHRPENTE